MLLAVAATKTGLVFSCSQVRKVEKTRAVVPASEKFDDCVPERPFSISSSQRTQGATASAGYFGAEIEQLVVEGLAEAFNQGREVAPADLKKSMESLVPLSKTMREDIESLRGWARTRARPASPPDGPPAASSGFARKVELPKA